MLVARNIEALMEQKNLDAAKLARASGLNPTGIYDILKGKSRSPKIETIAKIAKGLGVPVSVIFSGQQPLADDAQDDDPLHDELIQVFDQLTPEGRLLLMQAAKAWLPENAA